MKPTVNIERDQSIKGWECVTVLDDGEHLGVSVIYLDDGTTVITRETVAGLSVTTAYAADGSEVPDPIERVGGD